MVNNEQINNYNNIEIMLQSVKISTKVIDTQLLENGNIHIKFLVFFEVDEKIQSKYELLVITDLNKSIITE